MTLIRNDLGINKLTFNTTLLSEVVDGDGGGGGLLGSGVDLDGGVLGTSGHGLGLVLAQISGLGWSPVLLGPQSAAIGDGRYLKFNISL